MAQLAAEVTENYLKSIYMLSLDAVPVKTSRLAGALTLSPAAVTEMVKRLAEQGFVDYQPYQGVSLSEKGRRRALLVIRRHRLWEVFLHNALGIPWGEVHAHAERLEHATDADLAGRLDDFLGNPRVDPHGHPIPGPDGNVDEGQRLRLTQVDAGTEVQIEQCLNDSPELLAYLKQCGLVPGAIVNVTDRAPFNGPLTLRVGGEVNAVGVEAAYTLLIKQQ